MLEDESRAPLDVLLLAGVSETDRVCAAAMATLRRDAPESEAGPGLLAVLPADYLLAVYFALPEERRGQCESDPVWAYHLRRVPDGVEAAQEGLRELAEVGPVEVPEQILEPGEALDFRQFTDGLLRRALGMEHELSEEDEAMAIAGEGALADVMGDGDGGC